MSSIKKKVNDKNPHVALYALEVTDPPPQSSVGGMGVAVLPRGLPREGGQQWEQGLAPPPKADTRGPPA